MFKGNKIYYINAADAWTIIDYLTPLYGRYTAAWYELIRRLTEERNAD